MSLFLKKLINVFFFNSSLFFLLIIGIQNNINKNKVNFLINKSVDLPIGFIVGTSFITGSIIGNLFNFDLDNKN